MAKDAGIFRNEKCLGGKPERETGGRKEGRIIKNNMIFISRLKSRLSDRYQDS